MSHPQEEQPQPKQRFTGYWIPVELSKMDLTKTEQFLLAMIDSLEGDAPDYCFASNAYLAEKMELSESRISFYLTKFKRMKLIEEVGFDGRRRRIRTCKETWFSRKELCVNSRSPTTRTRECRVRDSTNHIEQNIKKSMKQQQKKVAKAPVVVFSKEEEKREIEADAAATQYIKAEMRKGKKVDETRIRRLALKEGWKPNKEDGKNDLTDPFKHGEVYKGVKGCMFECYKDGKGISFHNLTHPISQPQGFIYKSSTFVEDFQELLKKLQIKRT